MEEQQFPAPHPQILGLPKFGELIKRTWQIYKARLGTFLGILVLPFLFSSLSGGLLALIYFLLKPSFVILIPLLLIFLILAVILYFWSQVALIFAIGERERKIGVRESFQKGGPKIIPFFWISFLAGFITMGGFLLFIVPGIIFAVWFALPAYVLVSEDLRGMSALFKSKQLIKGNWWPVFWRFLLISLLLLIIALPLNFGASLISPLFEDIVGSVFSLLVIPFFLIFGFLIYEDLKRQKEKQDNERGTNSSSFSR